MLRPLEVARDVHSQQLEHCDAIHGRTAQADRRRWVLENRSDQHLLRLPAIHKHTSISRLLNELVDERLHAADCRPTQDLCHRRIIDVHDVMNMGELGPCAFS